MMTVNIKRMTLAVVAFALAGCPPPVKTDGGTLLPPPQAFLTITPTLIIAPTINGSVTTNGCKSVLGVQINATDGSFIAEVKWVGNPSTFEIDKALLNRFYAAKGIALSLSVQAKVVCDDGRSNLSQPVSVTFFPVVSTLPNSGHPTLPDSFIAEGGLSGTATTFVGCGLVDNSWALVRVDTKGNIIAKNLTLRFPCSYSSVITERSNTGFTRWLMEPTVGAFSFDKDLNIFNIVEGGTKQIAVAKDGSAILWLENGAGGVNQIARANVMPGDGGVTTVWSRSFPDTMIASPVVDTTNGWVYALSWQLNMGTGRGLIVMIKYSLADGTVLNASTDGKAPTLIKQEFGLLNRPIPPAGSFNVDGTLAYVALNGYDPNGVVFSVVAACATGSGGCENATRRWTSPAFGTPIIAMAPFSNGNFIAAISYSEVGFLSLTDGSLQNLGQKTLRPTGSLQFSGYQPGTGADFFMLASPGGGYPAEIIATDAPMNGELWRLNWGNGVNSASSMNIAVDEGGQAWLRIGLDQVKPLTLRDYRTARGATPMP